MKPKVLAKDALGDMSRLVAYYRVCPKKHGELPLTLAAQRKAVADLAHFNNRARILAEFKDVEKGEKPARPALAKAIACAKEAGAMLVIAQIGRLTRNPIITSQLRDSGVKFVCCDDHKATWETISILAAAAEERVQRISEHTKAGLEIAKARGVKLGSHRPGHWAGREHLRGLGMVEAAAKSRSARAKNQYAYLMPKIKELREAGRTLGDVANWLNDQGHLTLAGKPFTETAVWRIIGRYIGKDYQGHVDRGDVPCAPKMPKRMRPETYVKRIIKRLRADGLTFEAIAKQLNEQDRRMEDGSSFTSAAVRALYHEDAA